MTFAKIYINPISVQNLNIVAMTSFTWASIQNRVTPKSNLVND